MLQEIARLLGGVPGVTVSFRIQVDPNATTDEATHYRGLVIVGCDHAAAREAFSTKMKAKQLGPIPLKGTADEIEQDIVQGKVLGRIQERLVLAKEAEQEDASAKATKSAAPKPAAKTAAKAAPVKTAKTPEELKAIGQKATQQTSLLDEAEATEEAKPAAKPVSEAKMAAPQVGPPKSKKASQFVDLVDELAFAVNGNNKTQALEKIEKIKVLGKELNGLGIFKKGSDTFVQEAMDAYGQFQELKTKAAELPEDANDAPVFEGEEQEEAQFED